MNIKESINTAQEALNISNNNDGNNSKINRYQGKKITENKDKVSKKLIFIVYVKGFLRGWRLITYFILFQ